MRLVAASCFTRDLQLVPDTAHKGLGLLREVHSKQSNQLVFMMLEGEKKNTCSWLTWPKASELLLLRDARGFYGFTITCKEAYGVQLSYHFEAENKAHGMTDEQLKHIAPMSLVARPDLGLIGSEDARAELARRAGNV